MKLLKYFQKTKGITRDEFEDMIREKAIKVNGKLVDNFSFEIKEGDEIEVLLPDGQVYKEKVEKLPNIKPVIVIFNKPKGYVVSKNDPFNKTIFDILPKSWKKDFYYIGRLDKNSRGLLLLTNDPQIVDRFANPKNKLIKIYEVEIDKPFKSGDIKKVKIGILVDEEGNLIKTDKAGNFKTKPQGRVDKLFFKDVKFFKNNKGKYMLKILLTEGKKRHIRRVLKALGYKVKDLKRVKFGKYELGNLKEGKYRIVKNLYLE